MTQTIITKALAVTDTKGRRVKATVGMPGNKHSVTLSWEYALNNEANHRMAAEALAEKMGWDCILVSGSDGVQGYHNPLTDTTANCSRDGITNYEAREVQKVEQAMDDEYGAHLQLTANDRRGHKSRWLTIDRRMVRAIMALFNDQNA